MIGFKDDDGSWIYVSDAQGAQLLMDLLERGDITWYHYCWATFTHSRSVCPTYIDALNERVVMDESWFNYNMDKATEFLNRGKKGDNDANMD